MPHKQSSANVTQSAGRAVANHAFCRGVQQPAPKITSPVVQREKLEAQTSDVKTFTSVLVDFVKTHAPRNVPTTEIFRDPSSVPPQKPRDDNFGRPHKVHAEIDKVRNNPRADRKTVMNNVVSMAKIEQQAVLGGREEFYSAGHIVGDVLLSSENSFQYGNLIPQTNKLNLEQYNILENKIKQYVKSKSNKKVEIDASVGYESDYKLSLKELKDNGLIWPALFKNKKLKEKKDEKIAFPRWIPNKLKMTFKSQSGKDIGLQDSNFATEVPSLTKDKDARPHDFIRGYQYNLDKTNGTLSFKQWTPRPNNLAQLFFPAIAKFKTLETWEMQKQALNELYIPMAGIMLGITTAINSALISTIDPSSQGETGMPINDYMKLVQLNALLNQLFSQINVAMVAVNASVEREKGVEKIKVVMGTATKWFKEIAGRYEDIPDFLRQSINQTKADLAANNDVIKVLYKEVFEVDDL